MAALLEDLKRNMRTHGTMTEGTIPAHWLGPLSKIPEGIQLTQDEWDRLGRPATITLRVETVT